ncbi:MAG: stage II sporulation protein M [Solirubrobacteraceae bacterium]|nr:stage II sporulation protein M [Solirubrobacteraceae bacterium]
MAATTDSRASNLALVQGIAHTKETLAIWRAQPWPVLGTWFAASFLVSVGLLASVVLVASRSTPDPSVGVMPGIFTPVSAGDVIHTVVRNLLVLALHSLACVAGFIAGSSMPLEAKERGGWFGAVHDYAGRFAILFVSAATVFSLMTQAYVLGGLTADVAARLGLSDLTFVALLLPHALLELTGLFLPLAAWLIASRRNEWHQLLAATVVTTSIALVMVLTAAFIETYVTPEIIHAYAFR